MGKIDPKYSTTVTVTGGREGRAVSDDGVLDVQTRRPKLNGSNEGTNPEQLFGAAWGSCYQSALMAVARQSGDNVSASTVTVEIAQGRDAHVGFGIAAKISVTVPSLDLDKMQHLADAALDLCPYSRATRGNIEVEVIAEPSAFDHH